MSDDNTQWVLSAERAREIRTVANELARRMYAAHPRFDAMRRGETDRIECDFLVHASPCKQPSCCFRMTMATEPGKKKRHGGQTREINIHRFLATTLFVGAPSLVEARYFKHALAQFFESIHLPLRFVLSSHYELAPPRDSIKHWPTVGIYGYVPDTVDNDALVIRLMLVVTSRQ